MKKVSSRKEQPTLAPEVAEKYEVVEGVLSVFACREFGLVDLSKVNLEFAKQLEEKGYLKKIS